MSNKIEIRKLAEAACGTSKDSPEYKRFIAALNPTLLLDLTAAQVVERQEPAEWRYRFTSRGELSKWFPVDSYLKLYSIGNDPAYEIQPLYTSPPAPVLVVLDERAEFEKSVVDMADRFHPDLSKYGIDGEYKHAQLQYAWELWNARACLDKVKELNQ